MSSWHELHSFYQEYEEPDDPPQPRCDHCGAWLSYKAAQHTEQPLYYPSCQYNEAGDVISVTETYIGVEKYDYIPCKRCGSEYELGRYVVSTPAGEALEAVHEAEPPF
jgi:hypothetical protein